jgi:hypothetical protein
MEYLSHHARNFIYRVVPVTQPASHYATSQSTFRNLPAKYVNEAVKTQNFLLCNDLNMFPIKGKSRDSSVSVALG